MNTYGYASGDPVNYSDPLGLCPPIESCLALAGAGGGAITGVASGGFAGEAIAAGVAVGAATAAVVVGGFAAGYWIGTEINDAYRAAP